MELPGIVQKGVMTLIGGLDESGGAKESYDDKNAITGKSFAVHLKYNRNISITTVSQLYHTR